MSLQNDNNTSHIDIHTYSSASIHIGAGDVCT